MSRRSWGGHRLDDRGDPVEVAVVDLCQRLLHLPHARKQAEQRGDGAHLLDLLHLLQEVLEVEVLAALQLRHGLVGLVGVEVLLRLLDERHDVAHAEDP